MRYLLIFTLLAVTCSACLPEDERVKPRQPGTLTQGKVTMGNDYRTQVFYDLGTAMVVGTADKMAWDLAFDASPQGVAIWLNSSRVMQAAPTQTSDMQVVPVLADLPFRPDASNGRAEYSAMAGWKNDPGRVWVIDRGYTSNGLPIPAVKVRFLSVDSSAYRLETAPLTAVATTATWTIPKRQGYNRVYLSLEGQGSIQEIEPRQDAWDIQFTQYTARLFDGTDTILYLVTGVLHNPYLVNAALDTLTPFAAIDRPAAMTIPRNSDQDVIGYAWKAFDFDTGTYVVDPLRTYLIEDTEGLLYKLRFTDFYSPDGQKGAPQFEFQRL